MEWFIASEEMPEHGKPVIAYYKNCHGKGRRVIAEYIARWTEESGCDECNDEYSEEKDTYYLCEGWYERVDNWGDFSSIFVGEGEVTHWLPLPSCPGGSD